MIFANTSFIFVPAVEGRSVLCVKHSAGEVYHPCVEGVKVESAKEPGFTLRLHYI